jgi:hypothetical protein
MMKNKIFTEKVMSDLKRVSSSDARPQSFKKMLLLLAFRCQELEAAFRRLESAFEELKNHSSTLE